jgi:hypothetical protein
MKDHGMKEEDLTQEFKEKLRLTEYIFFTDLKPLDNCTTNPYSNSFIGIYVWLVSVYLHIF